MSICIREMKEEYCKKFKEPQVIGQMQGKTELII